MWWWGAHTGKMDASEVVARRAVVDRIDAVAAAGDVPTSADRPAGAAGDKQVMLLDGRPIRFGFARRGGRDNQKPAVMKSRALQEINGQKRAPQKLKC